MPDVTREELNGLGKRLLECELLKPSVKRNESDIQDIFIELNKIPENNNKIMMKMFFMLAVPTCLMLWQIFNK